LFKQALRLLLGKGKTWGAENDARRLVGAISSLGKESKSYFWGWEKTTKYQEESGQRKCHHCKKKKRKKRLERGFGKKECPREPEMAPGEKGEMVRNSSEGRDIQLMGGENS